MNFMYKRFIMLQWIGKILNSSAAATSIISFLTPSALVVQFLPWSTSRTRHDAFLEFVESISYRTLTREFKFQDLSSKTPRFKFHRLIRFLLRNGFWLKLSQSCDSGIGRAIRRLRTRTILFWSRDATGSVIRMRPRAPLAPAAAPRRRTRNCSTSTST